MKSRIDVGVFPKISLSDNFLWNWLWVDLSSALSSKIELALSGSLFLEEIKLIGGTL